MTKCLSVVLLWLVPISLQEDLELQNQRIVGGSPATISAYPYTLSLHRNGNHVCGATLINWYYALTAAHCLHNKAGDIESPRLFTIYAGSAEASFHAPQVKKVIRFVIHPRYTTNDAKGTQYDLGFVEMRRAVDYTPNTVQPVTLPAPEGNYSLVQQLKHMMTKSIECTALGWGYTKWKGGHVMEKMQMVKLPLIDVEGCQRSFDQFILLDIEVDSESQLCTLVKKGGRDACQGDSGGPLVCEGALWGVTSWGINCALANMPAVFARVDSNLDWINDTIHTRSRAPLERFKLLENIKYVMIVLLCLYVSLSL